VALSNLKLYQSAGSPNSRRVRIFLAEKGLKLTLVPVDLGKGEQRSDEYRLINPRQMVPVLVLTAIGFLLVALVVAVALVSGTDYFVRFLRRIALAGPEES